MLARGQGSRTKQRKVQGLVLMGRRLVGVKALRRRPVRRGPRWVHVGSGIRPCG